MCSEPYRSETHPTGLLEIRRKNIQSDALGILADLMAMRQEPKRKQVRYSPQSPHKFPNTVLHMSLIGANESYYCEAIDDSPHA